MKRVFCLAILASASIFTPAAEAATITFGDAAVYPFATYTESGYTFQVISGPNWGLDFPGNAGVALSSGNYSANPVGARLDLFLTGGGLFTFSQLDFSRRQPSASDTLNIFAEVNSVVTGSLLNFGATSTQAFQTALTGFGPVDRIRFEVASSQTTDLLIDNLVLNAGADVPEPATWLLMGAGLAILPLLRRRR